MKELGKLCHFLGRMHRFFESQSLYPIALSSALAVGIFAAGVYYSRSWTHHYLVWNLFLAWIPFICSMFAAAWYRLFPKRWLVLLAPALIWLVFFPNCFYIITDFLHLSPRPRVPLWYDIGLLAAFAWSGCFLAVASLYTMHKLVKTYTGRIGGWFFVSVVLGLNGLGIYLGRFDRWNSWDLLFHPKAIAADVVFRVADPFGNPQFVGFSAMFSLMLLVCYLMFVSFRRPGGLDN